MARDLMRSALLLAAMLATGCGEPYDVVLAGGDVHDGRGGAPRVADVGIRGDRVVTIGDLAGARAETRVDVSGLAVVPGFVDLHSHAVRGVLRHPLAENYLRQGVTTAMGGPDGGSPYRSANGSSSSKPEDRRSTWGSWWGTERSAGK